MLYPFTGTDVDVDWFMEVKGISVESQLESRLGGCRR
jgi:hypothetical protein